MGEDQQFKSVVSDKFSAPDDDSLANDRFDGLTSRTLALCAGGDPGAMTGSSNSGYQYSSDLATGMHLCRAYYYELNGEADYGSIGPLVGHKRTYCNWLRMSNVMSYCWVFDQHVCTKNANCGFQLLPTPSPNPRNLSLPNFDFETNSSGISSLAAQYDAWASNYNCGNDDNKTVIFSCGLEVLKAPPEGLLGIEGANDGTGTMVLWGDHPNGHYCKTNPYISNNDSVFRRGIG